MEPTSPYSNRELDAKFQHVCDLIKETGSDLSKILSRVEEQTTKTNGRVNVLEGWRQWIKGGSAAFSVILVPLFGWMLYEVVNIDTTIQTALASQLNNYQVKVTTQP